MPGYVLTLACADRPGLVHAMTQGLLAVEANITESAQYGDPETGQFFIRTAFDSPVDDEGRVRAALEAVLPDVGEGLALHQDDQRPRVLLMVSGLDHCLVDLLYRWRIGELPVDIAGIVSNHSAAADLAAQHEIAFTHIPVTPETKPAAEERLLRLVDESDTDLVVLARYMQILSDGLCQELSGRAINIHHSFLPGFKGARPYHQAHARGVKLIGATAHYVTGDLDEGPIIAQDVVRVAHQHTADELVVLGRDVERRVLAAAVRAHAEHRVFLNGSRTVVFA